MTEQKMQNILKRLKHLYVVVDEAKHASNGNNHTDVS